jgi:hypothetical protein
MIFVFATDDRSLDAFAGESDAIAYCEGIDVANGVYLFFGPDGLPLQAVFTVPAKTGGFVLTSGKYHLLPAEGEVLQQVLPRVACVEGQGLTTVEQVARVLTLYRDFPISQPTVK